MNKMKVCWISNAPSPYKVEFMNLLGKEVDLTCLFETHRENDREETWYNQQFQSFHAVFLDETDAKKAIQDCAKQNDGLINSDYSKSICRYAVKEFHKQGKKTILHADGGLAIPRGIFDLGIGYVMKQNDYFLSSGKETDKYFCHYGVKQEKIMHYHFACMSKQQLEDNAQAIHSKETLRKECGYQESTILFSVGQQIPRKGYDILAQAMEGLGPEVGLYIAGGEPEENVQKIIQEKHLTNIHFLGFLSQEQLRPYYAASDIFVLPTRYDIWGLVINEAMSFGLPIISTDHCVAALEFQNQSQNMEIVPINDVVSLHKSLQALIADKDRQEKLSRLSLKAILDYNFERMVEDFLIICNKNLLN